MSCLRLRGASLLLAMPGLQFLGNLSAATCRGAAMTSFPVHTASRARILVIGDIMLDRYWFGQVDRISPEAPVPVVHVARKEDRLGGAANVARNAAALGASVSLIGVVGDDEAGQEIVRQIAQEGINNEILIDHHAPTTLKMRVLGRQQQLLRVDFEERSEEHTSELQSRG